MIDANKILAELELQARKTAAELGLGDAAAGAKDAAGKFRKRLEDDPQTRTIAAGAGGLALLALLGSKRGRRFAGDMAKTGAVAGLGYLAWKAWQDRQGASPTDVATASAAGFPTNASEDPQFALAVLKSMLASAYADGVIDAHEARTIDDAMAKAGVPLEDRRLIAPPSAEVAIEEIAAAAISPNHAAELYAAAVVAAGDIDATESVFLKKLADRLGVGDSHAAAIRKAAL
jgi:uncharacterized membrane protein YebE (DUF533 family)